MAKTTAEHPSLQFPVNLQEIEDQIIDNQKTIDYDTKDFTVELLVGKFEAGEFRIPDYQRAFVWNEERQSKFIESVLLGLPIPFMFMADRSDGNLEVVDGAQRLSTLAAFLKNKLRLRPLEKLTLLQGLTYGELPPAQQRKFRNRSLRMIVLSDKTTPESKFSIFERINTGSDALKHSELRKGAYSGPFYNFVNECAGRTDFMELCPVGVNPARRGEREELVLRFFVYAEKYRDFQHDVGGFLNSYIQEKNRQYKKDTDFEKRDLREKGKQFADMLDFVKKHFPYGFAKTPKAKTTPRVRFEAISVGVTLALRQVPQLQPQDMTWLNSREFQRQTTTHGSNSSTRLRGRIEFVKDALLIA